ncbi:hypothetical protein [Actinoplanes sp. HUAS TT8]|uniref:hypothetical protein n=1 Tax=Actinoplanes sp. HUAS TT8 TaxID=3447453 RepID=UPI003F5271DC
MARAHLLQRTIGNAAAGELLRRDAAPIQRVTAVTPQGYSAGRHPARPQASQLTKLEFVDYMHWAVKDDYALATSFAPDPRPLKARFRAIAQGLAPLNDTDQVGAVADELDALLTAMQPVLEDMPNRDHRYSVEPQNGYEHTRSRAGTTWANDDDMWGQAGPPLVAAGLRTSVGAAARSNSEPAVKQLPWATATAMLPRPLLNLLFDVRYQLESGTVVDERTQNEKDRRVKSPTAPGTLRSWHQDDQGKLPGTGVTPGDRAHIRNQVPADARALHDDYTVNSQSGAGSSIVNPADGPRGLAEYTGTGSNGEHNTKVVLDYVNKRVYLTLTHYQYWALYSPASGPAQFLPLGTQTMSAAQGKIADRVRDGGETVTAAQFTLMSPWVQILM